MTVTASQWLVLDNLKQGWPYWTNLSRLFADEAYLWAVRNEYVRDGQLTDAGRGLLTSAILERE